MTLYVSNLSPETTRDELLEAFRAHGDVTSVSMPGDRMKDGLGAGAHRGYGFVSMKDRVQGSAALAALNGKPLHGAALSVRIARGRRMPSYVS